jgi:hypothetical protein
MGLECAREDRDIKAPPSLLLLSCTTLRLENTKVHFLEVYGSERVLLRNLVG